jgi:hypothetical protein
MAHRARKEAGVTRSGRVVVLASLLAAGVPGLVLAQEGAKPVARTEARERNLRAYVELLRSDLRTQKVGVITELMQFTEAEDTAFWPVYRDYELELSRLNDDRLALIERYAKVYTSLTASNADELMGKALGLESRRAALKQKYYTKLKTVVSPLTAARALQIENQIQLLLDLQIAASLPVVD